MKGKIIAFLVLYLLVMLGVILFFQRGTDTAYIDTPGTYGSEGERQHVKGNLTVSSPGVTLVNQDIDGNLYLSVDIDGGEVTLKGLKIKGSLVVMGNPDDLIIQDTHIHNLFVSGTRGSLRLVISGSTTVEGILLEAGAHLEEGVLAPGARGFRSIRVATSQETRVSGTIESLAIITHEARLFLAAGRVKSLEVPEQGFGSTLHLAPEVLVDTLILDTLAVVEGEGKIILAIINSDGAVLSLPPDELVLAPGVTAVIGGEEVPGDGEDEEEETGGEPTGEEARERPNAPLNFRAAYSAANNRVTLSWQPGDDHLTDRYFITRRAGQGNETVLGTSWTLSYTDSNLSPGTTYTYYLVAVCSDGYFSRRVSAGVSTPTPESPPDDGNGDDNGNGGDDGNGNDNGDDNGDGNGNDNGDGSDDGGNGNDDGGDPGNGDDGGNNGGQGTGD